MLKFEKSVEITDEKIISEENKEVIVEENENYLYLYILIPVAVFLIIVIGIIAYKGGKSK